MPERQQQGLFDSVDRQKRARLKALGWHEAAGYDGRGRPYWMSPAPELAILDEDEAFRRLERLGREAGAGAGGEPDA